MRMGPDEFDAQAEDSEHVHVPFNWFERHFGDMDHVFAYPTPKFVKVRDYRLGLMYISVNVCIFIYIVVFNIMYKCNHFVRDPVRGTVTLNAQQPTMNCNPMNSSCRMNFTELELLPYCNQYAGSGPVAHPRRCRNFDAIELNDYQLSPVPNYQFIPTRVSYLHQERKCNYTALQCDQVWEQPIWGEATDTYYVANIEDYTLLIDHSYFSEQYRQKGSSAGLEGYWRYCPDPSDTTGGSCDIMPITCLGDSCDEIRERHDHHGRVITLGQDRDPIEPLPSMVSIFTEGASGDLISVRDLMRLALGDAYFDEYLDVVREDSGESRRYMGAVIAVAISYSNFRPWSFLYPQEITYRYKVELLPANSYKYMYALHDATPDYMTRTIMDAHGLKVVMSVEGEFLQASLMQCIFVLISGLGLLVVAGVVSDFVMIYVCSHGMKYKTLKYQASESHHDFQSKTKASEDDEDQHFSAWLLKRCVQDDDAHRLLVDKGKNLLDLLLAHEERLNQIDGQDINFTQTTTRTGRQAIHTNSLDHPSNSDEPVDHRRSMTTTLMRAHQKTYSYSECESQKTYSYSESESDR